MTNAECPRAGRWIGGLQEKRLSGGIGMVERYIPTEAECICKLCGTKLTAPWAWLDTVPPDGSCIDGAKVVTDCRSAMDRAQIQANMIKLTRGTVERKDKDG